MWRVENGASVAFSSVNEGLGKVLRFGAFSPDVLKRLVAEQYGQAPTMHNVFMTYTGRSLDEDVEEGEADDE